ncbi:MAG: tetratricopeptide repeat protein [Candidatus Wallbacteria bacterium]|nr:tetratricopeptide repeat protein [Candidatus Wallbacteria bacterium]
MSAGKDRSTILPLFPAPPPGFCGRDEELASLLLRFDQHKVLVIAGIGGMGKTALARALAAGLVDHGRVPLCSMIWLECKEGWQDSVLFTEITQQVINITGNKSYSSMEEKTCSELLGILEENGLILFIDDFHLVDNKNSRELIRLAKDCLHLSRIVLTTRKRLQLAKTDMVDVFELRLQGLDLEHSALLMGDMLKSHSKLLLNDESLGKIFGLTKGHLFSLKLLAGFLLSGGYSTEALLSGEADFFREREELILDRIWEEMPVPERDVLTVLSVFRVPVKPEGVPDLQSPERRRALRTLVDLFIVDYNAEGRVSLQEVLKGFIRTKSDNLTRKRLNCSAAQYFSEYRKECVNEQKEAYFHFVMADEIKKAVDLMIRVGRELSMIGEEVQNNYLLLESAIARCKGYRLDELYSVKAQFLLLWSKLDEAESLSERIVDVSAKKVVLGRINFAGKQFREALKFFEAAVSEIHDQEDRFDILSKMAVCYSHAGDIEKADQCFSDLLQKLGPDVSPLIKAKCLNNYAVTLNNRGEFHKAIEKYKEAEDNYRKCGARFELALVLYNLAAGHFSVNDTRNSLKYLHLSLEESKVIGNGRILALGHHLLGMVLAYDLEFGQALKAYQAAVKIAEKHELSKIRAIVLSNMGDLYFRMGDLNRAEQLYLDSLSLHSDDSDLLKKLHAECGCGRVMLVRGEYAKAFSVFEKVLAFSERNQYTKGECFALYYLSQASLKQGLDKEAAAFSARLSSGMLKLPSGTAEQLRRLFGWFEEDFDSMRCREFIVLTGKHGRKEAAAADIESLSAGKCEYEIFIDFFHRELWVNGKSVDLFRKKTLVPLLFDLAKDPGISRSADELFERNWGREFDRELDSASLRKAVSRIRHMLDPDNLERFICSSEKPGSYFFNNSVDYCVIYKNKA